MVADVFAVEDTVRRNREAALEVLMGRIGQGKKEAVEVVKNEDMQRVGATPVGSEEDVDGEDVALGTIRARTSLSELADFFRQVSSAMDAIYAGKSYAPIKYRTENKSVHLNAPARQRPREPLGRGVEPLHFSDIRTLHSPPYGSGSTQEEGQY